MVNVILLQPYIGIELSIVDQLGCVSKAEFLEMISNDDIVIRTNLGKYLILPVSLLANCHVTDYKLCKN